jgi:prepilin-type N-terminal cleavage/methylation domain-containing protein
MEGGLRFTGQSARMWRMMRRVLCARQGGFTIIEVLIVLAVTGALFVSAAIMISGRQNQAAFDQSIRQIQSQIQQTLNEVATGFYSNNNNFQCTAAVAGQPPSLSAGSAAQGTNSGCIFLGKALQFRAGNAIPEEFVTYTVTGLRQGGAGGGESSSLAEARPVIVSPSITHGTAGYPDNSVTNTLQNGLTTARMWYNNGASDVEIGAIAFVSSLAQFSGGSIVSGAGQVSVVGINSTALGANRTTVVEAMNSDGGNQLVNSPLNPSKGVFVCFSSGGTDQYGVVKIGGDSRELSVTLTIKNKNNTTCS